MKSSVCLFCVAVIAVALAAPNSDPGQLRERRKAYYDGGQGGYGGHLGHGGLNYGGHGGHGGYGGLGHGLGAVPLGLGGAQSYSKSSSSSSSVSSSGALHG